MKLIFLVGILVLNGFQQVRLTCPPSHHECGKYQFFKCIPPDWVCDHNKDCEDGSDELNCNRTICKPDEFQCLNSDDCIPKSDVCDRNKDCVDNSDEADCPSVPSSNQCEKMEYDCQNDKKLECIPLNLVCGTTNGCSNKKNTQENCTLDMCKIKGSGSRCSHKCINKYSSFTCDCPSGMKLDLDHVTCKQIDVCLETPNICSQDCTMTSDGHLCSCYDGYKKVGEQCVLVDPDVIPHLLYMNYNGLYDLNTFNNSPTKSINSKRLIYKFEKPLMFDAKIRGKDLEVYSSYLEKETVLISDTLYKWTTFDNIDINKDADKTRSKVFNWTDSIYSIAVDPVRDLVFWTDRKYSRISVFNSSSADKINIIVNDCYNPINIVLDPISEKIYWIDLGTTPISPRIMMANMDGSEPTAIVTSGLRKSLSLAIDVENQRLYWSDLYPGSIKFLDLKSVGKGENQINILFETYGFSPYSLALHKHRIYWSDGHQNRIYSVHKISGKGLTTVMEQIQPLGIRIISPLLDMDTKKKVNAQTSINSCTGIHNPCQLSCLPTSTNGVPKCFGSIKLSTKNHYWWLILIPIALISFGAVALVTYRRQKSRNPRSVFVTISNAPVYNHVKFWDDDNEEPANDSQLVNVPDSMPIIQTV